MPRKTYQPEPGTKQHDRAESRRKGRRRREIRKIDRALKALADQELDQTQLEAVLRAQRSRVYGLLA